VDLGNSSSKYTLRNKASVEAMFPAEGCGNIFGMLVGIMEFEG
jgi:hypothetical protein